LFGVLSGWGPVCLPGGLYFRGVYGFHFNICTQKLPLAAPFPLPRGAKMFLICWAGPNFFLNKTKKKGGLGGPVFRGGNLGGGPTQGFLFFQRGGLGPHPPPTGAVGFALWDRVSLKKKKPPQGGGWPGKPLALWVPRTGLPNLCHFPVVFSPPSQQSCKRSFTRKGGKPKTKPKKKTNGACPVTKTQ